MAVIVPAIELNRKSLSSTRTTTLYRVTLQVSYFKKTVDPSGIISPVPVVDRIADGIFFHRLQECIYAFFCRNRIYICM